MKYKTLHTMELPFESCSVVAMARGDQETKATSRTALVLMK